MPVKALRANDLAALFSTMPKMEQDKARAGWDTVRKQANPMVDAGFAQVMQMLTAPGAVDQLMGMVEPTLKEIDLDEMASQFEMGMRTQNSGPVPIDEAMISGMTDWVAKAGFDDAAKARRALTHVVEAAKSFGVTSAEKLRALQLEDLLAHGSKALPHLKHAMGVYGIDIDTFLDSVRVNSITGTGAKREVQVSFSFLGKVQTVSTTLVEKDGCWFAEEKKGANLRPGPTVPSVSQE